MSDSSRTPTPSIEDRGAISPAPAGASPPRIAVIGAGVAGAACAAGLRRAGCVVTVLDKSRGVGGRMATRRAPWTDAAGMARVDEFDHGCPHFTASDPRFLEVVDEARRAGALARWSHRVADAAGTTRLREAFVAVPTMPAFCRHLLGDADLRLGRAVTRLQRQADGWHLPLAAAADAGPDALSTYAQVVLAIPAAQAAVLLHGRHEGWATALAAREMAPCWTLMAVTDDVDVPWDIVEPGSGALAWVGRNDRKPGRDHDPQPTGTARWVAHASPAWSLAHLEDNPAQVISALGAALAELLPGGRGLTMHHRIVHRWRYARPARGTPGAPGYAWSAAHGLGVCGDGLVDGSVEAAWCSGDELAAAMVNALQSSGSGAPNPPSPSPTRSVGTDPW